MITLKSFQFQQEFPPKKQCFKSVFVYYPNKRPEISIISKKLYAIRKLRNRIFHYEQIFKCP